MTGFPQSKGVAIEIYYTVKIIKVFFHRGEGMMGFPQRGRNDRFPTEGKE